MDFQWYMDDQLVKTKRGVFLDQIKDSNLESQVLEETIWSVSGAYNYQAQDFALGRFCLFQ
jgi:hypothetical protein